MHYNVGNFYQDLLREINNIAISAVASGRPSSICSVTIPHPYPPRSSRTHIINQQFATYSEMNNLLNAYTYHRLCLFTLWCTSVVVAGMVYSNSSVLFFIYYYLILWDRVQFVWQSSKCCNYYNVGFATHIMVRNRVRNSARQLIFYTGSMDTHVHSANFMDV